MCAPPPPPVRFADIGWHAFPFNAEPELFTPALFDAALNLTFAEDRHFGHPPRRTLSQRDVPGLTRAAIPLLVRRGVTAVSVGENSQVAPSAVPPIFVWQDNTTGAEVIAMFHALGYGGAFPAVGSPRDPPAAGANPRTTGGGVNVADDDDDARLDRAAHDDGPSIFVHHGRGSPSSSSSSHSRVVGGQSRSEACVAVDVAGVALCYAWKIDNSGPHTYGDARLLFDAVQ